jgi:hypothetical protein
MDALAFMRMGFEIDVRDVVPSINVPTLITHRVDEQICHVENARWLARHIPGAKYVELPGVDHVSWIDGDDILARGPRIPHRCTRARGARSRPRNHPLHGHRRLDGAHANSAIAVGGACSIGITWPFAASLKGIAGEWRGYAVA